MAVCNVCFRKCDIPEGGIGFCAGRTCLEGKVIPCNYGKLTALALDPIEKKPLGKFHPGSWILSVGSYGCNLRCPFCQNSSISWSEQVFAKAKADAGRIHKVSQSQETSPEELVQMALGLKAEGNIGLAFTYNEPLIGYEYVRDAARLAHEAGLLNVLVTNGTASLAVLKEIIPYIDAMNIDLKGFTEHYYHDVLGGERKMVLDFIEEAAKHCHVEITTLIVPGENDTEDEMGKISHWIAGLKDANGTIIGRRIPLHISRFFPQFHMKDRGPTPVETIYRLVDVAREELEYVCAGNCP